RPPCAPRDVRLPETRWRLAPLRPPTERTRSYPSTLPGAEPCRGHRRAASQDLRTARTGSVPALLPPVRGSPVRHHGAAGTSPRPTRTGVRARLWHAGWLTPGSRDQTRG